MRALAMTGMDTAAWISWIFVGSAIRATPPWRRMSAGTRSSAITATAPASSAMIACSALTTSMMTPPLSISASPLLTSSVPRSTVTPSKYPWYLPCRQRRFVRRSVPARHHGPVEAPGRRPGPFPGRPRGVGVVEQPDQGFGQGMGVAGRDHAAASVQYRAEGGQVAGHDRAPGRHRLGHDDAEALAARVGSGEDTRGGQQPPLLTVVDPAPEGDAGKAGRPLRADHHHFGVGKPGPNQRPGPQQNVEALAGLVSSE